MTEIKIAEKSKTIQGSIEEGIVKPCGNAAHILFPKKHTGKCVDVVIPDSPEYVWVLSEGEKKDILDKALKGIEKGPGQVRVIRKDAIERIRVDKTFAEEDLEQLYRALETEYPEIAKKIDKTYNLWKD